jgi:phosphoribosylaminoimidazole carboxylase (NCAIR synthetase)
MNCIFLSPHFPPHYFHFCKGLKNLGVNVLGIADTQYDQLSEDVKSSLTEYFKVESMEDYDHLLRAAGYFTHKYGKIDRIDSLNEYWMEKEARLRTDFNVFGLTLDRIDQAKLKSRMKNGFREAGIEVARGRVVESIEVAQSFIDEVGYPVVLKPNCGVGAAHTQKITDRDSLVRFFDENPKMSYIAEEFVEGEICTFDGLADREGRAAFYTSHVYNKGVMELAVDNDHVYYYSQRALPLDLKEAGKRAVKAFDIRERFFHIEFFRTPKNELVGLEVNMRPPGGFTTDMFNYACDIDIYQEWANMVVKGEFTAEYARKYHCCYIGRKSGKSYLHTHEEIMSKYGTPYVVKEGAMPDLFASLMGNTYYIIRAEEFSKLKEIIEFVLATSQPA